MAKAVVDVPEYVEALARKLEQELAGSQVSYQRLRRDRYRFAVVWKKFEKMDHPARQHRVWEIAESVLRRDDLLKVSMIITLAPSEVPNE
jgi:hypothetical protein